MFVTSCVLSSSTCMLSRFLKTLGNESPTWHITRGLSAPECVHFIVTPSAKSRFEEEKWRTKWYTLFLVRRIWQSVRKPRPCPDHVCLIITILWSAIGSWPPTADRSQREGSYWCMWFWYVCERKIPRERSKSTPDAQPPQKKKTDLTKRLCPILAWFESSK